MTAPHVPGVPSFPPRAESFTCDVCGKPGVKASRNQKRHPRCAPMANKAADGRRWARIRRRAQG